MLKIFLTIIFLIPSMLGLAEILHILKLYILKPSKPSIAYKIIFLTNDMPLEHMSYIIEQYRWQGRSNYIYRLIPYIFQNYLHQVMN